MYRGTILFLIAISVGGLLMTPPLGFAQTTDSSQAIVELKSKIDTHAKTIQELTKEIGIYQEQIKTTVKETTNLQSAIKTLDSTQKKLGAELKVTQNKISSAELTIQKIGFEINEKEKSRSLQERAIKEQFRKMHEADTHSLLESLLAFSRLSVLWGEQDTRAELQNSMNTRVHELTLIKIDLEGDKREQEGVRAELTELKTELSDKNKAAEYNKQQKATLLTQTQDKQENYKKVLAEKMQKKAEFEKELAAAESQLKIEIDKSKLPTEGSTVLSWPLDKPLITQNFGATQDAKRLYVSGTHNGIDLRAPNGTPLKASLSGIVTGTGNTDVVSGCYSYGKWVLIKHDNGLSTLYAHLSVISVAVGQPVATGEIIGYSGSTGYATGPHLHFTVYATQGVKVEKFAQGKFCKNVTMPVATKDAYLNPLEYLPKP